MWINFLYFLECKSGDLWQLCNKNDKASYWLDWLPALTYKWRKNAEKKRAKR
jgi:hypothetical protein